MAKDQDAFVQEIQQGFFGDFLIAKRLITAEHLRDALEAQKERRHLRIGELLCERGHLDPAELFPALREFRAQIRIGEILISNGWLRFVQLLDALDEQRRTGDHLGEILIRRRICTLEQVSEALELQKAVQRTIELEDGEDIEA